MSDIIYVENDNGLNVSINELETEINPEGYIFVRNGEKEIDAYIRDIIKPDLDVYSQNKQNSITDDVNMLVNAGIEQLNNFTHSECQSYITQVCQDKKNEIVQIFEQSQDAYASFVDEKNQEVENIVAQANAAAEAASSSKNAAATSAISSSNYSNNSKIWAEGTDSQVQALGGTHSAKVWADQALLASDGKADTDLSNLSSTGLAKFNAKQNTITGAATTITSANLTVNRALISNGSGKVAVSAVTSTELGYLDGVTSAIQTQLNAKANTSLSNISSTGKKTVINWMMPNYNAGVSKTTNVEYTATEDCVAMGYDIRRSTGGGLAKFLVNGKNIRVSEGQDNYATNNFTYFIPKGATYKSETSSVECNYIVYPLKGA